MLTELGIYPAVDPLDSTSRMLDPVVVGDVHYNTARKTQNDYCKTIRSLQDIIAILGMDELSGRRQTNRITEQEKVQSFLSQPFHVAEQFTGLKGVLVPIEETIRGFNMIMDGEVDEYPEAAFNLVGSIDEAIAKGKKMLAEAEK